MIDIEAEIYTSVRNAIKTKYPNAYVSGKPLNKPTEFPAVSLIEAENTPTTKTADNENIENTVNLLYEAQIFSVSDNKKTECKDILSIIDSVMYDYNFNKILGRSVPNMVDTSVYRMVGRYTAIADNNNNLYRR